jgi:hypothetical protein
MAGGGELNCRKKKARANATKCTIEQGDVGAIKREISYEGTAADLDTADDDERYSDKADESLANGVQVGAKERENESVTRGS